MVSRLLALCLLGAAAPALADGPEQLDQIEPARGHWQLEYYGAFGVHAGEAVFGVTDQLVLGGEAEFEGRRGGLRLDTVSAVALYRFADPDKAPLGVGLELQGGIDRAGRFAEAEARLILERRSPRWWVQFDAIGRHSRDGGTSGTGLAYSASASRALRDGIWLGVEASGQMARLSGDAELTPRGQHYIGPSLTIEREAGETGLELGFAWLQRVRGKGPGSGPRVFLQVTL